MLRAFLQPLAAVFGVDADALETACRGVQGAYVTRLSDARGIKVYGGACANVAARGDIGVAPSRPRRTPSSPS